MRERRRPGRTTHAMLYSYNHRMKFYLRDSRRHFSERYNVPSDVNFYAWIEEGSYSGLRFNDPRLTNWNPKGRQSNCPRVDGYMSLFAKFTDWQFHSTLRNIFVGLTPTIQPNAVAGAMLGSSPCIAINAGLLAAIWQCLYLWEAVSRVMIELEAHPEAPRMTEPEFLDLAANKFSAREFENEMAKARLLRALLTNGDMEFLKRHRNNLSILGGPKKGVPSSDTEKRNTREATSLGYVISHELAHVLLGHVTGGPTAAYAKQKLSENQSILDTLETKNSSQYEEAQADVFGFSQLMIPAFREKLQRDRVVPYGKKDRTLLAITGLCLEGAMITTLALQLVSNVGGIPTGFSTHPAPAMRSRALCATARALAIGIIRETPEPDLGPRGRGLFDRMETMLDVYYTVYRVVESIINRCK